MRLLYDLETDGLYDAVTTIHMGVTVDLTTGEFRGYVPPEWVDKLAPDEFGLVSIQPIDELFNALDRAEYLAGHNILDYDNRVIEKLHPGRVKFDEKKLNDTFVTGKLVFSNIKAADFERVKRPDNTFPKYLIGKHSLEAWGARLGAPKDDYKARCKELGIDPWAAFNVEMFKYGIQDVKTNYRFWNSMRKKKPDPRSVALEMAVAAIIQEQERNGFPFNEKKAGILWAELAARKAELFAQCETLFPAWWIATGVSKVDRGRKMKRPDLGHVQVEVRHKTSGKLLRVEDRPVTEDYPGGSVHTKAKLVQFNPSSRDHISDRLKKLYGWEPTEFTPDGAVKVDDDILTALPYPPCKLLSEYFMVEKRLAALAEGKQAWLKKMSPRGIIHGRCDPNGAGTGRATHSTPNLAQVPSCFNADGKVPYGHECRDLFTTVSHIGLAAEPWKLVGADASGLELRMLAEALWPYDHGAFAKELLGGDIHWTNVLALGLVPEGTKRDKDDPHHEYLRALAKRFIYAFLYGAGPELVGDLFGVTDAQIAKWGSNAKIAKRLIKMGRTPDPKVVATIRKGQLLTDRFLEKTPALVHLKAALAREWKELGFIKGMDGRPIYARSAHSLLNFRLQSDGAIVCKRWLVELHTALKAKGWKNGVDYMQSAWVHDEVQIQAREEIAVELGKIAEECVTRAGVYFNLKVPLAGDSKVGNSWAETH